MHLERRQIMVAKKAGSANRSKASKTSAPGKALSAKPASANLPAVSKQTAGGIVGAAIGGMVGGPIGSVVGGVAGAMIGNSAAAGQHPIESAIENVRSVAEKPLKTAVKRVSKALGSTMTVKAKSVQPKKSRLSASSAKKASATPAQSAKKRTKSKK